MLGIAIEKHLNFNIYLTDVCNNACRKLNPLWRVSSLLSYQQKKVLSSYFISVQFNYCHLFGCLVLQVLQKNKKTT